MSVALPFPIPPTTAPAGSAHHIASMTVFVRGLSLEAEIGVNPDEYGRSQPLIIDVELDLAPPERCEHIAETVNYEAVGRHARRLAEAGHVKLIETFAQRLAEAMMTMTQVLRARVRIEKPQALAPHAQAAGVEITPGPPRRYSPVRRLCSPTIACPANPFTPDLKPAPTAVRLAGISRFG